MNYTDTAGSNLKTYEKRRYTLVERYARLFSIIVPSDAEQLDDVSFYQAGMKWGDYPFRSAIIRIGQNVWKDTSFEKNYIEAKLFDIALGGYFFFDDIQSLVSDKKTQTAIKSFVRWRESLVNTQLKFKIRVNHSHILIYGNDLQLYDNLLTEIKDSVNLDQIEYYYVKSNPNYDRSVIYLQKPKRKFRIYLKSEMYSTFDREKLLNFMIDKDIYMCRSFTEWLNRNNSTNFFKNTSYSWDHFFFELDDETLITLILLKFDRLIRKVCAIEKR
jgi:hypothetical protein